MRHALGRNRLRIALHHREAAWEGSLREGTGTITTETGFKNLYEMDTIRHVKKDMQYPAVMVTTGLNDPRVASWEPAQVAATLQASGTTKPVLLRIDEEAGHGIGSTKTQTDTLTADWIAFVFWRAGLSEWQPK